VTIAASGFSPTTQDFLDNAVLDIPVGDVTVDTMVKTLLSLWIETLGAATTYRVTITGDDSGIAPDIMIIDAPTPASTVALTTVLVGNVITIRLTGTGAGDSVHVVSRIVENFKQ